MRLIQLVDEDGDDIGLYLTERGDDEEVNYHLHHAFDMNRENVNPADEYLENHGIERVFVDVVNITLNNF